MPDVFCEFMRENIRFISKENRSIFVKEIEDEISSYKEMRRFFL